MVLPSRKVYALPLSKSVFIQIVYKPNDLLVSRDETDTDGVISGLASVCARAHMMVIGLLKDDSMFGRPHRYHRF